MSSKDDSIGLDARVEAIVVDMLWPGAESLDSGRRVGDLRRSGGFTVLCFLGCTIEHLQGLGLVFLFFFVCSFAVGWIVS